MNDTLSADHLCREAPDPIPLAGPAPVDAAFVASASIAAAEKKRPQPVLRQAAMPCDALALGVVLLLASTVLQRAVGFAREICFCRWLSPEQLGQWDMAFGFSMMAGPLLVMSLPGTFGRYVERYRQSGQLRHFFIRTAGFCAMMAAPLLAVILVFRSAISYLVFGSRDHAGMVVLMAAGLVFVVAFNYVVCVFTSLRNMKVVSLIELGNSVFFGLLGIGLLCCGQTGADAMIVAYGTSCLLCAAGRWRGSPASGEASRKKRDALRIASFGRGSCRWPPGFSSTTCFGTCLTWSTAT